MGDTRTGRSAVVVKARLAFPHRANWRRWWRWRRWDGCDRRPAGGTRPRCAPGLTARTTHGVSAGRFDTRLEPAAAAGVADAASVALSCRQVAVPVPGRAQRVVAAGSRARRVRGGRELLLVAAAALGVLGGRGIRARGVGSRQAGRGCGAQQEQAHWHAPLAGYCCTGCAQESPHTAWGASSVLPATATKGKSLGFH
jgi:hypothetical protein